MPLYHPANVYYKLFEYRLVNKSAVRDDLATTRNETLHLNVRLTLVTHTRLTLATLHNIHRFTNLT